LLQIGRIVARGQLNASAQSKDICALIVFHG
jgi:hypothetical protein